MKYLISILALVFITGCASTELTTQEMALVQAQMDQQTLQIDCPAGCSVKYRDPRDTVQIPRRTTGWDAAIAVAGSTERLIGAAIVPAAMAYQGVELGKAAIGALKGSGAVTTNVGDYSGDYSGSTGDYSGEASGNAGEIITGNSGSIGSPVDSTHAPTVVNQPAPVVVEQPEPIVIRGE